MAFKAHIYKVGINAVVEVPASVTKKMKAVKGYIPVVGRINGFEFKQTLCPVKDSPYRLYVNMIMLKGGKANLGDTATFTLKRDTSDRTKDYPMNPLLRKHLVANKLVSIFNELTESRRKEINRYLSFIKTKETLQRNIDKVINSLKQRI
jgi:hypothetical protein